MKKTKILMTSLLCLLCACGRTGQDEAPLLDEGISWELAQYRKTTVSDVSYGLSLTIPEEKEVPIEASEEVRFSLTAPTDVILDFDETEDKIHEVSVNEAGDCKWRFTNGHIVIPERYTRVGENTISVSFTAGTKGLNRRDGYVYTLFVPAKAHTVFPCFDQPNLKARFSLDLDVPEGWQVAQNGPEVALPAGGRPSVQPGRKHCRFVLDTPIPTYLFAFAAGEFQYQTHEEDGYTIGAFYRETDPARIAQLPEIMHQVVFAMKWQASFTGVDYPFPKYDLVILPGFQFGGMEHVGATFYNDNTLFLPDNPTPDEQLRRTELIAHETSHMWFGDAVTMDWFNDVWTKEVFANYFAAEITEPLFPELNHELNFLRTYQGAAVSQDRTEGRTSIRQQLDNMNNAGLVYNNIIYNKAPVMMRKMVALMGKEAFREGIRLYVQRFMYGNATWDDLVGILDSVSAPDVDLRTFSKDWVDTPRWPHYTARTWDDERIGSEYGIFELTVAQADSLLDGGWQSVTDRTRRQALLMNLYENYLAGYAHLDDVRFLSFLIGRLSEETDPLTASTLISYMHEPIRPTYRDYWHFDRRLWQMAQTHPLPQVRTNLMRLLIGKAETPDVVDSLYATWQSAGNPLLSINDYNTLAYELSVRMPEKAAAIISTQKERNTNPDRRQQFEFVARAVVPSAASRDSLFASLSQAENRKIEPWTLSVLYYLNHPLRQAESVKYIRPALELLWDIQRTGDIFFPANWCNNLLAGHRSPEAYDEVDTFLYSHADMLPLLRNKVLSAAYFLNRSYPLELAARKAADPLPR